MLDLGLYLRDKEQNQSGALNRPFGASRLHPQLREQKGKTPSDFALK